jgi:hypothetical protein
MNTVNGKINYLQSRTVNSVTQTQLAVAKSPHRQSISNERLIQVHDSDGECEIAENLSIIHGGQNLKKKVK